MGLFVLELDSKLAQLQWNVRPADKDLVKRWETFSRLFLTKKGGEAESYYAGFGLQGLQMMKS